MFYIDPVYLWCVFLPTLLISLIVQLYLRNSYSKWSKIRNSLGMTGAQVGAALFQRTSLKPVPLRRVPGVMSDHFDPRQNVVGLSEAVSSQPSVASMAICAHELGHVQQYQTGSALIGMRNFLLPAVQFSPTVSYIAIFIGLLFNMAGLVWVGIFFFALMVVFSILTLPVELNASRRAQRLLQEAGLLQNENDAHGVKQVLNAAALTYLAAAVTSILQLLYYISLARRRT